jgi:hypothetical protein
MTIHSCQGLIDLAKAGVQTKTDRDGHSLPGGHKDTIKVAMGQWTPEMHLVSQKV